MYKVEVKGTASTDSNIYDCEHIECHDCFTDYIDDNFGAVSGGYLRFKIEDGKLWSITTYDSSRELTEEELHELGQYTQGQWSDGIGEGFEQMPCGIDKDGEDIYISPWHVRQKLSITQEKIN